jgi:tRNA (adenine37-N6)-methyltransferase
MDPMATVRLEPIGVIRSPFTEQAGTPIQPANAGAARGHVEVLPRYTEALRDLDGFERIWLVFLLDRAGPWRPVVQPYRDTTPRGLFATRAPSRPCPIGMSVVRLVGVRGSTIEVEGVDALDETPLLDIKPYVPEFDAFPSSRAGWFDAAPHEISTADGRFSKRS